MKIKPSDWNVVIVGRWNTAIFTPQRIKDKLFSITDPNKQVEVLVPLDGYSPYQVKHPTDNISVIPDTRNLIISPLLLDFKTLATAKKAGVNALNWLPETPLAAAGFNIRFQGTEIDPDFQHTLLKSDIDHIFPELEYVIASTALTKSLKYQQGILNVMYGDDNNGRLQIGFNFHCSSNDKDQLISWLQISIDEVEERVMSLIGKLGLTLKEMPS